VHCSYDIPGFHLEQQEWFLGKSARIMAMTGWRLAFFAVRYWPSLLTINGCDVRASTFEAVISLVDDKMDADFAHLT